jgi:hypothetical protein
MTRTETREAARQRWAQVDAELSAARNAVNGGPLGTRALLPLGPLARHHQTGVDVTEGRDMLTRCLVESGSTPDEADALVARLEIAYAAWLLTEEIR